MGCERKEDSVNEDNMFEIVDYAFSVEEVHGRTKEIPVQRSCERQIVCPTGHIGYRNDLLEGNDLDERDDAYDIDVARKHGKEETGDHDKSPYCPGNEGLLLLLIIGLNRMVFLHHQIPELAILSSSIRPSC